MTKHFGMALMAGAIATAVNLQPAFAGSGNGSQPSTTSGDAGSTSPVVLDEIRAKNSSLFTFDYTVPTSPALELAGLPKDTTTSSASLKPFVLSLPGLLNSGSSGSAASFDMSPAWAFGSEHAETQEDYFADDNYWGRFWFRTRVGIAATRGEAVSSSSKTSKPSVIAAGVSFSLADSSDPLMASQPGDAESTTWLSCLDSPANASSLTPFDMGSVPFYNKLSADSGSLQEQQLLLKSGRPAETLELQRIEEDMSAATIKVGAAPADPLTRVRNDLNAIQTWQAAAGAKATTAGNSATAKVVASCKQEASNAAQHGAALDAGFGAVAEGAPGKFKDMDRTDLAVWLAGRIPLAKLLGVNAPCEQSKSSAVTSTSELACWTFGGSGRFQSDEIVATGNKATPNFNARVIDGWLGIERTDSNSRIAASYGYLDQHATSTSSDQFSRSGSRWLVSASYNLTAFTSLLDGIWLEASYGKATGTVDTLNDKTFMLTLNFTAPKSDLFGSSGG